MKLRYTITLLNVQDLQIQLTMYSTGSIIISHAFQVIFTLVEFISTFLHSKANWLCSVHFPVTDKLLIFAQQ